MLQLCCDFKYLEYIDSFYEEIGRRKRKIKLYEENICKIFKA